MRTRLLPPTLLFIAPSVGCKQRLPDREQSTSTSRSGPSLSRELSFCYGPDENVIASVKIPLALTKTPNGGAALRYQGRRLWQTRGDCAGFCLRTSSLATFARLAERVREAIVLDHRLLPADLEPYNGEALQWALPGEGIADPDRPAFASNMSVNRYTFA